MAYLIIWQFIAALGWRILGEGPAMQTVAALGPAHKTVGLLVFTLVFARLFWTISNRRERPADPSPFGLLARITHGLFYLLMIAVPGLALAGSYGSGKGLALWGIQWVPRTGRKIEWLVAPANLLHSPLAWILAILVAGHVVMALFHSLVLRDGLIGRMAGPFRR